MTELRVAPGGVEIVASVSGPPAGATVVVLHGFTGSASAMAPLTESLAQAGWRVIAPDLVGHGRSAKPAAVESYAIGDCAAQVAALIDRFADAPVAVVGYSMGGRVGLRLALDAPERVRALVTVGASPGLIDPVEAAARRQADAELADAIERDGVEAFVERWMANPLFATQARLPAAVRERARVERLANDPLGLANSLRGMGTGSMPAVDDELPGSAVPMHFLAGSDDLKFRALADRMAGLTPHGSAETISNAGHAAHLEQPATTAAAVLAFLEGVPD